MWSDRRLKIHSRIFALIAIVTLTLNLAAAILGRLTIPGTAGFVVFYWILSLYLAFIFKEERGESLWNYLRGHRHDRE